MISFEPLQQSVQNQRQPLASQSAKHWWFSQSIKESSSSAYLQNHGGINKEKIMRMVDTNFSIKVNNGWLLNSE